MDKDKVVFGAVLGGVGAIETALTGGSCPFCILAVMAGAATAAAGIVDGRKGEATAALTPEEKAKKQSK